VRENILDSSPSTFQQETPVKRVQDDEYDDYDDTHIEPDVSKYGREKLGEIASPYLTPYVYNRRFLDRQYDIRRVEDNFKIGDSFVTVNVDSNLYIKTAYTCLLSATV
jgi:hypothetical protein